MGRGRGRQAILAAIGLLAVALAGAGCGSQSHPNDPRPPLAADVTVNITDNAVQVEPAQVGVSNVNNAPMDQNKGVTQPSANATAPLIVNFTSSNTTATNTTLEIHGSGGAVQRSGPIVAEGNNTFKVALSTGHYTIDAADLPGAKSAPLYVGPARVSSQNDLLLP